MLQVFLVISYQLKLQVITLWSRQEIRCKIKDSRNLVLWTMWLFICDFFFTLLPLTQWPNIGCEENCNKRGTIHICTKSLSHLVTVYAAALWPTLLDLLDSCHAWKCKGIGNETSRFKPQKKKTWLNMRAETIIILKIFSHPWFHFGEATIIIFQAK